MNFELVICNNNQSLNSFALYTMLPGCCLKKIHRVNKDLIVWPKGEGAGGECAPFLYEAVETKISPFSNQNFETENHFDCLLRGALF